MPWWSFVIIGGVLCLCCKTGKKPPNNSPGGGPSEIMTDFGEHNGSIMMAVELPDFNPSLAINKPTTIEE